MRNPLFFVCVIGAFFGGLFLSLAVIFIFIAAGAFVVFALSPNSGYLYYFCVLLIDEFEGDIIYALDRAKKISKHEGWLSFEQILQVIGVVESKDELVRRRYQIALSHLIRKEIVEVNAVSKNHLYRIKVECVPEKEGGIGFPHFEALHAV